MLKKYLTYILLAILTTMMFSCGSSSGGNGSSGSVDKGFLDKYKYTIMSQEQIDAYVKVDDSYLKINGEEIGINFILPEMLDLPSFDANQFQGALIVEKSDKVLKLIVFKILPKENKFDLSYIVYSNDKIAKSHTVVGAIGETSLNLEEQMFLFKLPKTELKSGSGGESLFVEFSISQKIVGGGSASVSLKNKTEIFITGGDLGRSTYASLKKLLDSNPNVTTIVFGQVDGSIDDKINVETGRMIRNRGLNTKVLKDSNIASGAVDLFAAGVQRIYTIGAIIGVHSWGGPNGTTGNSFANDHKAHHSQLGYFTAMLPSTGYDFYFFTLNAAVFNNIHNMSISELKEYKLITLTLDIQL